eukprot:ANDGO_03467.mRNA.1 Uncharacterized protein YGR266W
MSRASPSVNPRTDGSPASNGDDPSFAPPPMLEFKLGPLLNLYATSETSVCFTVLVVASVPARAAAEQYLSQFKLKYIYEQSYNALDVQEERRPDPLAIGADVGEDGKILMQRVGISSDYALRFTMTLQKFPRTSVAVDPLSGSGQVSSRLHETYWCHYAIVWGTTSSTILFNVPVPSIGTDHRMAFYSCNGFQVDPFSSPRMQERVAQRFSIRSEEQWGKFWKLHESRPVHVLFGIGDQLYCDGALSVPEIYKRILCDSSGHKRKGKELYALWTAQHDEQTLANVGKQVEDFAFSNYRRNWNLSQVRRVFASIPQINTIDDHDVIDGYNCYPPELLGAPLYQLITTILLKHVYLFQHHVFESPADPHHKRYVEQGTMNLFYDFGSTAVICVDTRTQRNENRVVEENSMRVIMRYLDDYLGNKALDAAKHPHTSFTGDRMSTRSAGGVAETSNSGHKLTTGTHSVCRKIDHLLIVFPVPILFPRIPSTMQSFAKLAGANVFGLPELKDDLRDQWRHRCHREERWAWLRGFHDLGAAHHVRMSFVSGDVHVGGRGYIYNARDKKTEGSPWFMNQIITSAMVNECPPHGARMALTMLSLFREHVFRSGKDRILSRMEPWFKRPLDKPLRLIRKKFLIRRRNFAVLQESAGRSLDVALYAGCSISRKHPTGLKEYGYFIDPLM